MLKVRIKDGWRAVKGNVSQESINELSEDEIHG